MEKTISREDFAHMLNGRQYGYPQFSKDEIKLAKKLGFIIVCGASDDLMEFEGAICDEDGCFDGGTVYFNRKGVIVSGRNEAAPEECSQIHALWCKGKDIDGTPATWAYETDIPHDTFRIWEGNELYCIGIVFSINDVAK